MNTIRYCLSCATMMSALSLFSSEVRFDEAETAARQWVASCAKVGEYFGSSVCNLWEAKFSTDGIKYYVAEFEQGGFVVLTSDTRCDPVIFYSARGTFPTDETHPLCVMLKTDGEGLAAGLSCLQISSAAADESSGMTPENRWNKLLGRPQTAGSSSAAASTAVTASEIQMGPFVQTQWGQSTANDYTPGNGADVKRGYFILGCGATALSQIMYTMRWPQAYVAPFTCTRCTSGGLAGTTFTALGGNYPWDLMTTDGYPTGETREIMSRFMGDVGIAICTQWHTNSDGTTGGSVELWHGPMAVTNFFGYSNAQFYSNTNSPGSSAISPVGKIRKVMKSNLDAGLPVMIEIHGSGGHEVVGDGYAVKDGLFYTHINFGWTGISDGWYAPPKVGSYTSFSGILYNLFTNRLTGASIASGRILVSGSPVSGARVCAYSGDALVGTATSNEKGIYALILPPGEYDIVARTATKVGRTRTTLTKCSGYSSKAWNASGYYSGKVLPPEGINCGNECDVDITLVTSSETKGELVVAGEPQAYQIGAKPLPYGSNVLTNGQTVTISAPGDFDFLEATHRLVGRVIGYRVDSWDGGDWVEGTPAVGTNCTLTQGGTAKQRLVWLWETKPSVRLYGRDGVELSADNVHFSSRLELTPSAGDSLTVYARRTDSTWFVWEGAPEGSAFPDAQKRQMTMTVTAGEEIVVSPAEGALVVTAEPREYFPTDTRLSSIAYGESSVVVGATQTYTAPSFGATNLWFKLNGSTIKPYVTDGVRGCVAGYRLDTWADGEWQLGSVTNASLSCSYTQTSDSTNRLVWIWNAEARLDIECQNAKVTADVNGGTAAQSQSAWVPCGTPAVINLHYSDSSAASVAYGWSIDGGLPPTNVRIQLGVSDSRAQGLITPVEGHAIVISIPPSYELTVQSEPDFKIDGLPYTGVTNVMNGVDLLKAPEGVYTDPSSGRHYRVMGYVLRRVYGFLSSKTTNDVEYTGRACSQFVPQAGGSSTYSLIWKWFEVNAQGELVYVPYMITSDPEKVACSVSTDQATSIVPVFNGSAVISNSTVIVRAVPADGYRYETAPEGWTKDGVSIVREYAADVSMILVSVPDPTEIPPAPPMPYDAYEQANLVAMWDCSTNLTASGWTDTSGRYTFAWSDPTLIDIASNGVKILGAGGYGLLADFDTKRTFGATNALGYSTIELVFDEGTTDSQYFFESSTKKSLVYTVVSGDTPGFSGSIGRNIKTATNVDMTSGRNTVTVRYFGDSYKNPTNILINAQVGVASKYATTVSGVTFNGTYLGKGSATTTSATDMWCRSRISAIRIYSNHLTSEQISANREIDQNRVFAPQPSPEPPTPPPGPTPEEQEYPFAAKDTISILTLGNSYSHYAVAGQTSCLGMIEALGKKGRIAHAFKPYGSFSDHWNNHTNPKYCDLNIAVSAGAAPLNVDPSTWTIDGALENENWDIVMLLSSPDEMWYPWADSWSATERSAYENLVALIHEKCPNAKIYLMQFWAYGIFCDKLRPHVSIQDYDAIAVRDAQYENIVRNYDWAFHRFDDDANLAGVVQKIIPAGYAQILYNYRRPLVTWDDSVQLMSGADKNFHPSNGGYVVQSLTWVRAIFGRLPDKGNLHQKYKDILAEHGADLDTAYECVEDACKAAHSRYYTYRKNVDFRYNVTIKNYDGTPIGEVQSVTNRGCATLPDPATIKVGEGYEFAGWRTHMNNPYADDYKTYTDAEMRAFKVFDTLDIIVKRRHTGEVEPERVWTGRGADNSWNTKENWEPEVVPDANSDVFIPFPADATNTVTVSVPSAIAINSLTVGSGNGLGRAVLSFDINDFAATNTVATTVTVNSNGFITCHYSCQGLTSVYMSRVGSLNYRVTLKAGGNFIINKGGAVDVVSRGFPRGAKVTGLNPASTVPGACGYGYTTGITTWYGGSHGGISGQCKTAPACASTDLYPCYGSIRHPLTLGSSGATSWGGGGIHLIAVGDMLINGEIRANGEDGRYKLLSPDYGSVLYGSGAGGSVWLEAHAFSGTGTVDVRGGVNTENANRSRACGGSGRIAIYTQEVFDHAFSVAHEGDVINLLAGPRKSKNETSETDNYHGGGTIYIETITHEPGHGVLYIDGGNVGTADREYATQIGSLVEESGDEDAYFATVVLQNRGRLYLTPGSKLYTRELTIRGDDPLTTCTDSAYDPTLGTVEIVSTHHFGAWVTNTFANCTNAGERVRICTDDGCGLAETNVIAALGHDWSAWVTNPAPTKVSTGLRTRACQRLGCGCKEQEVVPQLPDDPDPPTPPPGPGPMPDYLAAVDYIESSGVQYIDTLIGRQDKLLCDFDFEWTTVAGSDGHTLMGHFAGNSDRVYVLNIYSKLWRAGVNGNATHVYSSFENAAANTRYSVQSYFNGTAHTMTIGGTSYSYTGTAMTSQPTKHFQLFRRGDATAPACAKLYACKIYTNATTAASGVLARDYRPAYNYDTEKYGLYDAVTGTFTPSAGTTDFTGAAVPPRPSGSHVTLAVTCDTAKQTYKAYTNGTTEVTGPTVASNAVVTVVATPAGGYEYATVPTDWTAGTVAGTITRDFTASTNPTTITVPDATEIYVPPAHTHTWSAWTTNVAPNCTQNGYETRICIAEGCEEPPVAETNVIAALGHDWTAWYTNVVPTVGVAGELRHDCQRQGCGAYETQELPPLDPPPPVSTDWISNVGFDGRDSKWGTLPTGANFLEDKLVLKSVISAVSYPGLMPVDLLKTNLVVDTTVRFKPYRTLPPVRDAAKCGIIARFDDTATNYWVLAKKSNAEVNEWADSGRAADTTGAIAVRMTLVTASNVTTVEYRVGEAAEPIVKTVYVPSTAVRVTFMGSGEVAALKGWTSDSSEIKSVPSVDIGGGTQVPIIVESSFLKANGLENASAVEVSAALSKTRTEGNRMKLIDSYVLGLDPNVETSVPIVVSPQNADTGLITLTLGNVEVRVGAGAAAVFRPLTSDTPTGTMTPIDGLEESPLPIFDVGVPDRQHPVKYYKIGYRLVAPTK